MPAAREIKKQAPIEPNEARFVFTGTVEQVGSSSLFFVPPSGTTAVVRIERIHRSAPVLKSHEGQQVTVVFADGSGSGEGRRLFFTNPILYGETMAVREVRASEAAGDGEWHERILKMNDEAERERVRSHIADAEVVVQGRVIERRPTEEPDIARMSEHDPLMTVAVLRVARTLKGKHEPEREVLFPKSRDVAWYRVPKLEEGQEGIFVLHRHERKGSAEKTALALLHPDDFVAEDSAQGRWIVELSGPQTRR